MTHSLPAVNPHAKGGTRLASLDVVRTIAAIAVVMIHLSAATLLNTPQHTRGFQLAGLINQMSRFALPAFVLITGAGLFFNYGQRSNLSLAQYYARRLKSLGIPYLCWSLIYFTVYRIVEQDFSMLLPRFLAALVNANAVYTFYYFVIIVPFYVVFPLLRPLARNKWLGMTALVAILGNGFLVWFGFPHPKVSLGPLLSEVYPYAGNTPLWWMGPFFLGAWLAVRWEAVTTLLRRYWVGLSVFAGVLLVWVMQEFQAYVQIGKLAYVATNFRPSAYAYGLVVILALIGVGIALAERGGWVKKLIQTFSKYSFAVYLAHPLVMQATAKVLSVFDIGPLVYLVLQAILVLGLSYLAAWIIDQVPGGGLFIGVH